MRTQVKLEDMKPDRQYVVVIGNTDVEIAWTETKTPYTKRTYLNLEVMSEFGCPIYDVTPEPEPFVVLEWKSDTGGSWRLLSDGQTKFARYGAWLKSDSPWSFTKAVAAKIVELQKRKRYVVVPSGKTYGVWDCEQECWASHVDVFTKDEAQEQADRLNEVNK